MGRKDTPTTERFWAKVEKHGPDECWNWTGARQGLRREYGAFTLNGVRMGAHRASWTMHNGPVPEGLEVCHKCDNGLCVNPAHLWLGTHLDNMMDKIGKNRHNNPRGSNNTASKLVESDIPKILKLREQGLSHRKISKHFGVSYTVIRLVLRGEIWKHVPRQPSLF